jgi:very-short-patch-repair endonuclease
MCQADGAVVGTTAAQQLLQHLDQLLPSVLGQLRARELANIIWSCAYTQYVAPVTQLLAAFLQPSILSDANSQHVANVLWALATTEQQVPQDQLQQLVDGLVSQADKADPQHISNSLLALGKLGYQTWDVFEQLEQLLAAFEKQLHRARPQEISNTLVACARYRHRPVQLLAALEQQQHMQRFLAGANPQELANTTWACGMLGHDSKVLLGGLLQQAVKLLRQDRSRFICQELRNMCWAVAVLDLRQYVPAVLQFAEAASQPGISGSAKPEELQQLCQVHLWLLDHNLALAEGGKGPGLLHVLLQQQLDECSRAAKEVVATNATAVPSLFQRQVFKALQQLPGWQVHPTQEKLTDDHNFSIDIVAVTAAGVRLAVEVDGQHHFVKVGDRWEVNGPTQYRDRALIARGYTVVSIPWWEWKQLKGRQQQKQYLQRVLKGSNWLLCFSSSGWCGLLLVLVAGVGSALSDLPACCTGCASRIIKCIAASCC